MASKFCMALMLFLGNELQLGNSFVFTPTRTATSQYSRWKHVCPTFLVDVATSNKQMPLSMSTVKGMDEKLRSITTCLLEEKDDSYWSEQLNEEQIEDAKYAAQAWVQSTSTKTKQQTNAESAEYTEKILKRLALEKQNGNDLVDLDVAMYELLIDIWSKLDLPERAESILNDIQSINDTIPNNIQLNETPYNKIIHLYKRQGNGEKAENVLRMMQKANIEPVEISYNGVVVAYAKNYKQSGSADQAQRMLEEMGKANINIDTFLFNTVMDAYAKSRNDRLSAQKAEALLDRLESLEHTQPNTISYTSVIDAYAKSNISDRAESAERVFRKMEAAHKAGNTKAEPNVRSFNAVINAHVQTNRPGSALRAEELLMKMIKLSKNGFSFATPNVVSFTTVMNGWAKSGESGCGERAQTIYELALEQYEQGDVDASPNSFTYSALLDAWIKSRDKGSVDKAFEIFSFLCDNYNDEKNCVKPNTFLANQVMDAVSKSGKFRTGDRTEEVLGMLNKLYDKYKDDEMKPNAQSYTITMNAWAKSRSFGKAKRTRDLLTQMEKAYKAGNRDVKPNVFAYTAVLNACAFTVGDLLETKDALQIASSTYKELIASTYDKPNAVTFATFLRVCLNLIPEGESQSSAIMSVFKKCCEYGQVNQLILDIATKSLDDERLSRIMGLEVVNGRVSLSSLPSQWKCNAKETYNRKRRR